MNIREIILDILLELEKSGAYVNILLASVLDKYDYLATQEKAFIKRVTQGTIERRGQIDYMLNQISKLRVDKMKPLIRQLLRMSAYQIIFMESVPDSAVCNEAVKLAKKRKFVSLAGYVNGVLRNLAVAVSEQGIVYPDLEKEPILHLSIMYSMPEWLTEHFISAYGREKTEKILEAFLQDKPVTVRFAEKLTQKERDVLIKAWQEKGAIVKQSPYLSYAVQVEKSDGIKHLKGYEEGLFMVQDVSSMLVVEAADIKKGQTVIDVCAAPGGKSLHAASKLDGSGKLLSFDLTQAKVDRLEENKKRMHEENMITAIQDARSAREELYQLADVVLADVPCSGLGVIGRKQDIKYHVTPQSMEEIITLQKDILKNVANYVKPGGILMYSTCTMNPEENEKMVEWFCDLFPFEPESIDKYLPQQLKDSKMEADKGRLQLFPGVHDTDGFFFAKLRRTSVNMPYQDIKSLTLSELQEWISGKGEKPYRAKQLYEWMHVKLARNYDEMTNIPKSLKEKCSAAFTYTSLKTLKVQESKIDGTKKFLFELPDQNVVESVWMRYKHGNSVCISSQVGCRMGCKFCASTIGGWERNLLPSEMLEQIYAITLFTGERVSNVVVMGTGEPLDNYDNLLRFLELITDENGLHISQRNVTVSTCGIVPAIYKLAQEKLQITLALSLHAAIEEKRRKIMPIANEYSLDELMAACVYYFKQTGRRVTFEYSLINGVNDTEEDISRLTALIGGLNCHINLIPVNPIKERDFRQPDRSAAELFKNKLEKNGINVTIRREMGRDIDGACGQLRRSHIVGQS